VYPSGRLPSRTRDALRVFALALLARLAIVAWAHARFPPVEDGHFYDVFARRLASGAGYTWLWPDGVVTYAAHYPVGYPALLAVAYAVFGASGGVAMTFNALVGAASAYGAHRIVDGEGVARWRPLAAGIAVALHPALVPYTAAVMTEGVNAALLVIAAAIACRARETLRPWAWIVAAGFTMGIATLVRPQSLLLAPVLGVLAAAPGVGGVERLKRGVAITVLALVCVAPWTARNCVRMHKCALVSVNGGWNLLIGAQTARGGYEPLDVPPECATVWDEAAKDACFARAARARIAGAPGPWLVRVPAKLAATFDYFGAAPWYLHASNAAVFDERSKMHLGVVETAVCRGLLLLALVAGGRMPGLRATARKIIALAGAAAAVTVHGWLGYVALLACVALLGGRALARAPIGVSMTAAVIAATAVVHAVVFGDGRYGLVVVPFVTAMAFSGRDAWGRARGSRLRLSRRGGTFCRSTPLGRSPVASGLVPREGHQGTTGGKSELHRARCRTTPGGGNAEESATEKRPPSARLRTLDGKGETAG
jgi:4-amino-4-deoxy-L-arabinose transferase-like glycosyltransferase